MPVPRVRLGKILEIDPTLPRPVTVRIHRRQSELGPLHLTSFAMTPTEGDWTDESGSMDQLFVSQIRFSFKELTASGRLKKRDRLRLYQCLSQ